MAVDSDFSLMGLPHSLLEALQRGNYIKPTPIQLQTIPIALQQQDILGSAQTGTGKTLAFVLPMIARMLDSNNTRALILTPTRELAQQVISVVTALLGKKSLIKSALLIGGEPFFKQREKLKVKPRIIVGTPGRIIDHFSRQTVSPDFNFLILDETDRMFDMGFGVQLEKIINQLPAARQTLMFSATFPLKVQKLAAKYLVKPARILLNSNIVPVAKLREENINLREQDKYSKLLLQLQHSTGAVIIFVNTKFGADKLYDVLNKANYNVTVLHGDLTQGKRERVMRGFRSGLYKIMVATDIAARGLDVPQIQYVINYDLPNCPEDYVHRVGRTARAGASGCAVNLITTRDQIKWNAIQRFMDPKKPLTAPKEYNNKNIKKFKKFKKFSNFKKH